MDVLADRYELGDLVGAGGMARVMQARDLLLERPVAVKLLREDIASDDDTRERFLREARTAAQFNHPNAVAVFDSGEHHGDPWIVMELIDGEDLNQRIRRTGPLEEAEALRIADSVLAALEAAHRDGYVHRDVKPANIMLLDDGSVKLADFGIAKSLQDAAASITGTGQIIGTARYLAPEQVSGRPSTPASDVYAMGIVLYEMLAGRAPYTGSDPIAVAVAHTHEPVPDVPATLPHVSAEVAGVITRALAKDPAQRYGDAGELRSALLGAAGPQPLLAAPAAATTAVLPRGAVTRSLQPDDAPTLDPAVPAPTTPRQARAPWLLYGMIALALMAIAAVVAAGVNEAAPEITTDAAAEQEPPAADDPVPDAAEDPAADTGDAGETRARGTDAAPGRDTANDKDKHKGEGKGKGKGGGNGKAKGKAKKD